MDTNTYLMRENPLGYSGIIVDNVRSATYTKDTAAKENKLRHHKEYENTDSQDRHGFDTADDL